MDKKTYENRKLMLQSKLKTFEQIKQSLTKTLRKTRQNIANTQKELSELRQIKLEIWKE